MGRFILLAVGLTFDLILHTVRAAGPLNQSYFEVPAGQVTGLLLLNPPNATCEVLIGLQITGSSSAGSPPEPTASPVSSIVTGNLTFQISDLSDQGIEAAFGLIVDVPPGVTFATAVGATLGQPMISTTNSSLVAYVINSTQTLAPDGADSAFVNSTIKASSQDFAPRAIFLQATNGSAEPCALAFAGHNPNERNPFAPPSPAG